MMYRVKETDKQVFNVISYVHLARSQTVFTACFSSRCQRLKFLLVLVFVIPVVFGFP